MAICSLFLCFFLLILSTDSICGKRKISFCFRDSVLLAAIVWALLLTISTEIFSLLKFITFDWLLSFWCLLDISLIAFLYHSRFSIHTLKNLPPITRFNIPERIFAFILFVIIITTAVVAVIAPPNTYDALTYHMPRVFHWIQNQSVSPYPTWIPRQLFLNPWAEFAILHFQILSGGDYFVNLVQWFSMIGCLIGVSLITKEYGGNRRAQLFSAAICITIPMGILQSTSAQNDYVASFWYICFIYFTLLYKKSYKNIHALAAACSLGIALLTKAYIYLYAAPFVLYLAARACKKLRLGSFKLLGIISLIIIAINLGFYVRNFEVFGNVFAPANYTEKNINSLHSPASTVSNLTRNATMHLGIPDILGGSSWNTAIYNFVKQVHESIGLDINDSRTSSTWDPNPVEFGVGFYDNDGMAGNFVHLVLIAITATASLILYITRKEHRYFFYSLLIATGFLLFCIMIRWHYCNSRYHLPLFVAFCPIIALVFSKKLVFKWDVPIAILLAIFSINYVFDNPSRSLVGSFNILKLSRTNQYFTQNWPETAELNKITDWIKAKDYTQIGLITSEDWAEYSLIMLLEKNKSAHYHIEHINVQNDSSKEYVKSPIKDFKPQIIVVTVPTVENRIAYDNIDYFKSQSFGKYSIFVPL